MPLPCVVDDRLPQQRERSHSSGHSKVILQDWAANPRIAAEAGIYCGNQSSAEGPIGSRVVAPNRQPNSYTCPLRNTCRIQRSARGNPHAAQWLHSGASRAAIPQSRDGHLEPQRHLHQRQRQAGEHGDHRCRYEHHDDEGGQDVADHLLGSSTGSLPQRSSAIEAEDNPCPRSSAHPQRYDLWLIPQCDAELRAHSSFSIW